MSQINVHDSFFDNIKSKRLRARFGELIDVIPIRLWCYASKHHPEDGLFKNYTPSEICSLINYSGDPEEMLLALLEFGFLDKTLDGWYKIHEWEEYQGHIISFIRRGKENAKKRWDSHRKNANSIANSNAPTNYTYQLTNKDNIASRSFMPPILEEVKSYCLDRKNTVDPQKWHDFYTAKNWMIGKNKMRDWKAAVRTWENRETKNGKVEWNDLNRPSH